VGEGRGSDRWRCLNRPDPVDGSAEVQVRARVRWAGRPVRRMAGVCRRPRTSTSTRARTYEATARDRVAVDLAGEPTYARRRRLPPPTHHVPGPAAAASFPYRHTVRAHTRTRAHTAACCVYATARRPASSSRPAACCVYATARRPASSSRPPHPHFSRSHSHLKHARTLRPYRRYRLAAITSSSFRLQLLRPRSITNAPYLSLNPSWVVAHTHP
jgi:hypothetical protein